MLIISRLLSALLFILANNAGNEQPFIRANLTGNFDSMWEKHSLEEQGFILWRLTAEFRQRINRQYYITIEVHPNHIRYYGTFKDGDENKSFRHTVTVKSDPNTFHPGHYDWFTDKIVCNPKNVQPRRQEKEIIIIPAKQNLWRRTSIHRSYGHNVMTYFAAPNHHLTVSIDEVKFNSGNVSWSDPHKVDVDRFEPNDFIWTNHGYKFPEE